MSSGASGRIPLLFLRSRRRITPLSGSPPVAFASTARGCAGMMTEDLRVYYSHTDPCSHLRWTARECHQFMYDRPWHLVSDFYAAAVCGRSSLRSLFPEDPIPSAGAAKRISGVGTDERGDETDPASADFAAGTGRRGRWARSTFKIDLGYHGGSFDGWQKQPGLNTVQGVMETALGEFVDEKKAQRLKDNSLPVNGCALVAGRTDKGVSALRQVCSFYTWNESVKAGDIKDAINSAAPGKLRALSVSEVSRVFHPNFSAKWRQYLYIFPLLPSEINNLERSDCDNPSKVAHKCARLFAKFSPENFREFSVCEEGDNDVSPKNYCFSVSKVNQLLIQLEGKSLSYKMFARDTKASRSTGPPTECYVFRARAAECQLPCDDEDGNGLRVMCVELVANRFLRRMVRVLVATSIREAAAGASDDSLLNLMDATCRRSTAPPAPPDGLCLANVGYDEFSKDCCLIP